MLHIGGTVRSAKHGWFLASALSRPPQKIAADTAQSLAAVRELDSGVRYTVVAPASAPVAPAHSHYVILHNQSISQS